MTKEKNIIIIKNILLGLCCILFVIGCNSIESFMVKVISNSSQKNDTMLDLESSKCVVCEECSDIVPPQTCPTCKVCESCVVCKDSVDVECKQDYTSSYVQGLIIEAKKCEKNVYYSNLSVCETNLNRSQNKLEECSNTLCSFNSSWC